MDGIPTLDLLEEMQGQTSTLLERTKTLDALITKAKTDVVGDASSIIPNVETQRSEDNVTMGAQPAQQSLPLFYSSTCSSFHFCVVKMKLNQIQHSAGNSESPASSIDDLASVMVEDEIGSKINLDVEGRSFGGGLPASTVCANGDDSLQVLLQAIPLGEATRLVRVYHDLLGYRVPILDINPLVQQIRKLYIDLGMNSQPIPEMALELNQIQMEPYDVEIIKIVLAVALASESASQPAIATNLYQSVQKNMHVRVWNGELGIKDLMLLLLIVRISYPFCYHHDIFELPNLTAVRLGSTLSVMIGARHGVPDLTRFGPL